jgi:hypothetical protein
VTEDFDRGIFQVKDDVLKRSVGTLYARMWGPHGRGTIREWAYRALAHVFLSLLLLFFIFLLNCVVAFADDE